MNTIKFKCTYLKENFNTVATEKQISLLNKILE